MKKEFLENLGLTAEQIKGVQEENGKDIEKHKQATLKIETEKDELKTQLAETEKRLMKCIETQKQKADKITSIQGGALFMPLVEYRLLKKRWLPFPLQIANLKTAETGRLPTQQALLKNISHTKQYLSQG